jgi:hypothetical protein
MRNQAFYTRSRLYREKETIHKMIALYCRKKHQLNEGLCEDCQHMMNYADQRLSHCPFGESKPVCSKCKVHCYQPNYREQIKSVMRFSGPRMLLYHPGFLISHYLDFFRYPSSRVK